MRTKRHTHGPGIGIGIGMGIDMENNVLDHLTQRQANINYTRETYGYIY